MPLRQHPASDEALHPSSDAVMGAEQSRLKLLPRCGRASGSSVAAFVSRLDCGGGRPSFPAAIRSWQDSIRSAESRPGVCVQAGPGPDWGRAAPTSGWQAFRTSIHPAAWSAPGSLCSLGHAGCPASFFPRIPLFGSESRVCAQQTPCTRLFPAAESPGMRVLLPSVMVPPGCASASSRRTVASCMRWAWAPTGMPLPLGSFRSALRFPSG